MDGASAAAEVRFGPSRRIAAAIGAAAVLAGLDALFTSAATGRLLLGIATVVLAAIAISDFVFSPRLVASRTGLTVFAPWVRTRLAWAQIEEIRVDERSRLGLASRALEIDAGDVLLVLGKRSLGQDPIAVLAELNRLQP